MARFSSSLLLLLAGSVSAFAAADTGLLSLLPSDTQTVASVNVDSSRSSSFGQFILRQMSANDQAFQEMVQQTGFDPRRDLQTFIVASSPSQDANKQARFLVLARGLFNQTLITAKATAKGMTPQTIGGSPVLVSTSGQATALTFPEVGIAAFGDLSSVGQVLANRANPSTVSTDLQAQIAQASAHNDAWFASTVPASSLMGSVPQADAALGGPQGKAQLLRAVVQSSGGIRFGSNVQLSFNALTRSDKDATFLTDLIRFISSAIQMQRQNDPRAALLAPAIDGMKLSSDGRQVYTTMVIPEADLEQIMDSQAKATHHAR